MSMKLRYSPTSPYVRKVMSAAHELGMADKIRTVPTNVFDPGTDIAEDNPLGKVPTLITAGGEVLYDSPVICEYLDSLAESPTLIPPSGGERWIALRQQALADGMLDAGVLKLLEGRRPDGERSPSWIERLGKVVARGQQALEVEADAGLLDGEVTIGGIAVGCALGWLDFRFSGDDWRPPCPALARWFAEFSQRPSMQETEPREAK